MLKILENECAKKIVSDALLSTLFYVNTGKLKPQQDTVDTFLHITWDKEIENSVYIRLNKRIITILTLFAEGLTNQQIIEKIAAEFDPTPGMANSILLEDMIAFLDLLKTPKMVKCITNHYPELVDLGKQFSWDKLRIDINANKEHFMKLVRHLATGIVFD